VDVDDALPGADLIRDGLRDLAGGVESIPAMLVLVGGPRLRSLGFDVPDVPNLPEHRLYELLEAEDPHAAHSRYNALIRRLVSFERAAECGQPVTSQRLRELMRALAAESHGEGHVYLAGGASAVLLGWRDSTVVIDVKVISDDSRVLRAVPAVKERLNVNMGEASPDNFIPPLPGWRERSPFIAREGGLSFHHYDFYAQCLAKIERGHPKDRIDAQRMVDAGLVDPQRLRGFYDAIEPELWQYGAIHPPAFRREVEAFIARQ
jgi:hypothetical protein